MLKQHLSECKLDVLVYAGARGLFEHVDYVDEVIETPNRPRWKDYFWLVRKIFRRYQVAVITQHADRAHIYGLLSSRCRYGILSKFDPSLLWKKLLLRGFVFHFSTEQIHASHDRLALAHLVLESHFGGKVYKKTLLSPVLYCRPTSLSVSVLPPLFRESSLPLAMIHPASYRSYKDLPVELWSESIRFLREANYKVLLSGAPSPKDQTLCSILKDEFSADMLVFNAAGHTKLADLICILQTSTLFLGVDTVVSHIAASLGIRSLVFFGPSDPSKYGSIPAEYFCHEEPYPPIWASRGNLLASLGSRVLVQRNRNVTIFQAEMSCVPCRKSGCDDRPTGFSDCLQSSDSPLRFAWPKILRHAING
jgi:heptosyltransferase-3